MKEDLYFYIVFLAIYVIGNFFQRKFYHAI